ncbi:SDR family NAD(P)-dependent oxidoreductase [Nocardia brasiliensis]
MTVDYIPAAGAGEQITLFRASAAQQRMWFLNRLDTGNYYYNVPLILRFSGAVRHDALQLALAGLVARHEILRTTFVEVDGELMQAVTADAVIALPRKEIETPVPGSVPPEQRPAVRAAVLDLVRAPFDLSIGPLLRAHLLDLRGDEHLLVLTMHHIIVDGWSIGVMCEDLRALYTAEMTGVAALLPPLDVQIGDMAEEEQQRLAGPVRAEHLAYWRSQLAGELTAPALPFDRDRQAHSTFRGATFEFTVAPADTAAVVAFGRDTNTTTFMTLLAVFYALIYRYSGSNDQVVGVPMANREDSRTAPLVGLFVNTVPLRAQFDPDAGFIELLNHVREVSVGAAEHQELPLEQIVEEVAPGHLPGRNPLFAVLFAMQHPPPVDIDFGGTPVSSVGLPLDVSRADLELHFWQMADHITGHVVYSTELFDAATIEQLQADYVTLLRAAIAAPHLPIRRLPIGAEQAVVIQSAARLLDYPANSVAIACAGVAITHAELRTAAAGSATAMSVARDGVVALALERGPDLVAALVATVSVGVRRVVWLPPSLPRPYRERSLRELTPDFVVTAAVMAAARATGATEPLILGVAPGRLDGALAAMLVTLLRYGRMNPDDPVSAPETVLIADHQVAPPGVLGELCVGSPGDGVLGTGVPARLRRNSSVEVARTPRGLAWDGYRWADLVTAEAVLLGNELIHDCAILSRRTGSGATELVAYVATSAPAVARQLTAFARATLPPPLVPSAFVPVAALPVTASGALDLAALHRLPVIDDELVAEWSARLPAAQIRVAADLPDAPRIHVGAPGPRPLPARAAEPEIDEPAVLDGGPAVQPVVASLAAALVRAARESVSTELIFLDESGNERALTYPELLGAARRVLRGLRESGLVPGDLAIVHLSRNDDFVTAVWGCFLGGIVPVPVDPNSAGSADKVAAAWDTLDQPMIIAESEPPPVHPAARTALIGALLEHDPDTEHHEPGPDALALLLLTSGSTGRPKAVRLTHRNILARSAATARMNGFGPADISCNWMPLEHVGGIVMFHLRDVYTRSRQVHASTSWVLADPLRWLVVVDRYRVTNTWAPNFAYGLVVDRLAEASEPDRFDLASLRFILDGGEAIAPRSARRFLRTLARFGLPPTALHPAWGMSETSSAVTYSDRFTVETTSDTDEFAEVGKPIPGTRIRIVDEDEAIVSAGRIGRLQVCGSTVADGYHGDPARTQEVFSADGWFDTGDLGLIRDGALTLTGRANDRIIVNGVNYTCHSIESAIEECPFVARSSAAAVAVRPPGSDTDALAIMFSLRAGAVEGEALADVRARMVAAGPNPDFLIPVPPERIPKTDIGKIQRSLLRQQFAAGEFADILRRVELAAATASTVPNWFFRPVWRRRDRLRPDVAVDGSVLLLGEPSEIGTLLADRLAAQGVQVVHAATCDIAAGLFTGKAMIRAVVQFVAESAESAVAGIRNSFSRSVFELVDVVRALPSAGQKPALYVVGCGAQAVTDIEEADAAFAPIPALLQSAAAEIPGLRACFIDLDPNDPAAGAHHVAGELGDIVDDVEVAYRSGTRWVKRLERLPERPVTPVAIVPGAMHLISGGLGGLASELARLLIERFDGRVLLVVRRDPDERQLATYRRLCDIAGAESVRLTVADVCDVDQMWDAVTTAETDWGLRLSSIWHLAGEYREHPLVTTTDAELADVSAAKVAGVCALHRIALRRKGIRFVSFSSVNGFFGGATVGGYSAANAYLDAFTRYQRRNQGIDAHSIAWTMWDRVGISAYAGHPEIAEAIGYRILGRAEALNSLLVALSHGEPHVLVGLDDTKPAIRARTTGSASAGQVLVAELTETAAGAAGLPVHDRYGGVVPTRVVPAGMAHEQVSARDETERRISAIWRQVFGFDRFGVTDSFFDLGGNSVLLARVHGMVQDEFGRPVPLADLFRYPTVSSLAAYLSGTDETSENGEPATDSGIDRARIRKNARSRRVREPRR